MLRRIGFLCFLLLVLSTGANAQTKNALTTQLKYVEAKTIALKQVFQTKRDWHVTAYKPEGDDAETGDLPVKVCFWFDLSARDQTCTPVGDNKYPHQNLWDLSIVSLVQSSSPLLGIVIDTAFSGGGSGIARDVSISTYDSENDVFSELVSLPLGELSEYRIINSGTLDGSIITASGLWQRDEGHFGDHRFWIQVYKYSNYYGGYEKFIGYLTIGRYPSEQLGVIENEIGTISRLVATAYGNHDPLKEPTGAKVDAFAQNVCIVADPTGTPLNVRATPAGQLLPEVFHNGANVIMYQTSRDTRSAKRGH